jgi:pimeloyl-ACP methyl ester carboxylesterase
VHGIDFGGGVSSLARNKLPVIYVRGFAGSNPDKAVDDPFYGFNEGAVHVRVDGHGEPRLHQFESPLIRLMTDEDYRLFVHGGQREFLERQEDGDVDSASVWVHRFYDISASTFTHQPQKFVLEKAAGDLFELVKLVLAKTGADRVHLVAHSMGGLICRSMIQRTIPDDPQVGGAPDAATQFVESLFTYGTPHGGIEFDFGGGVVEKLRNFPGIAGRDIFGPTRMFEYLTSRTTPAPSRDDFRATVMPDNGFPVDRVFCLVGTNPEDYSAAQGLSAKVVGARSDGLVQIDNAYVSGAHRAFVHRAHSGRYGMVNSEEGYQNLRRFLFGDLKVRVDLANLDVPGDEHDDSVWQLETALAIRGLPVLVHEQSTAHHCPVQLERRRVKDTPDTPVPLLTTFLSSEAHRPLDPDTKQPTRTLRHALRLRVISVPLQKGRLDLSDHLEQTEDWQDVLVVDIALADNGTTMNAWAVWNSLIPGAIRSWKPGPSDSLPDADHTQGRWVGAIPLPPAAHALLGDRALLRVTVTSR